MLRARSGRDGKATGPLSGFALGVAGIAWALASAARLLGEARYLDIARAGIAYERTLFVESIGNWRDLRLIGGQAMEPPLIACRRGAAGIGLGRATLLDIAGDASMREEIGTAQASVLVGGNFSLCHGDLGNLDLLPTTGHSAVYRYTAAVLAGIDQHGWVSGLPGAIENPALMVGPAGTGCQLLRLADPAGTPSLPALEPPVG